MRELVLPVMPVLGRIRKDTLSIRPWAAASPGPLSQVLTTGTGADLLARRAGLHTHPLGQAVGGGGAGEQRRSEPPPGLGSCRRPALTKSYLGFSVSSQWLGSRPKYT